MGLPPGDLPGSDSEEILVLELGFQHSEAVQRILGFIHSKNTENAVVKKPSP